MKNFIFLSVLILFGCSGKETHNSFTVKDHGHVSFFVKVDKMLPGQESPILNINTLYVLLVDEFDQEYFLSSPLIVEINPLVTSDGFIKYINSYEDMHKSVLLQNICQFNVPFQTISIGEGVFETKLSTKFSTNSLYVVDCKNHETYNFTEIQIPTLPLVSGNIRTSSETRFRTDEFYGLMKNDPLLYQSNVLFINHLQEVLMDQMKNNHFVLQKYDLTSSSNSIIQDLPLGVPVKPEGSGSTLQHLDN